jgi:hypothetical protein
MLVTATRGDFAADDMSVGFGPTHGSKMSEARKSPVFSAPLDTGGMRYAPTSTVCLDVMSLATSRCGHNRGNSGQRVAHTLAVHGATQREHMERPQLDAGRNLLI